MTGHDAGTSTINRFLARTGDGAVLVVAGASGEDLRGPLAQIERIDGTRTIACPIGRVTDASVPTEATLIAAYAVGMDGVAAGTLTETGVDDEPSALAWGALGLPDGLDTPVRPVRDGARLSDLEIARRSRAFNGLEHHATLGLAPGDELAAGEVRGVITAIDRRAGTLVVEGESGETVTLDLDQVDASIRRETT